MKRNHSVLVAILMLLSGILACSVFSNTSPSVPEVLFEESDFLDTGCFFANSNDEVAFFVEEGAFHIEILVPDWYALSPCLDDITFSDFVVEVDATQEADVDHNLYGLMFRYDNVARDYYYFGISGDGNYTLVYDNLNENKPTTKLIDWKYSDAINIGSSSNHLKVMAVGDTFQLYVNDQLLEIVQDSRISSGSVGFVVSAPLESGVHIVFDNLIITAPEDE
ncbi:MAG: hypothetical protein HN736_15405 [Anaerolineae bacterium]|jgi:hypothetical protein|nr:hypothetical protein [Anaerolineae bacterium]MBT3714469.1 hypothetical protein [Anaerolineae bacterium]MBT4308860.1 hypothetical protein [Anaerolineae bacterium]MBT4457209.1 hypothetical protein [Anaerolineae bacterium]MBT4841920.1 hypothetical protein [Anaerolineae bacterium]